MSGSDQPMKAKNIRAIADPPQSPLAPGGAGPHDPTMEARMVAVETGLKSVENRLTAVEVKVDHLDTRITSLETKVDGLDARLRQVEILLGSVAGKLDLLASKIPSWWQPPASAAALLALLLAAIAAAHALKIIS